MGIFIILLEGVGDPQLERSRDVMLMMTEAILADGRCSGAGDDLLRKTKKRKEGRKRGASRGWREEDERSFGE